MRPASNGATRASTNGTRAPANGSTRSSSNGGAKPTDESSAARGLGVMVACHHLVCAIPTEWIIRLALPEDVTELSPGVLGVGGERFATWDLGERLGLPPLRVAWCLLRLPTASGAIALALGTGTCHVVAPLPVRRSLPSELFTSRRGAIAGVFVADEARCGIELDVARLWTPAELAASAALLRSAGT